MGSSGVPFSLSAGILSSLPFSTLPLLLSVNLTAGYQLWGRHDHGGMVYLGIGYDRIDEEDNQKVPNHIKASIGQEVVVGLKVNFYRPVKVQYIGSVHWPILHTILKRQCPSDLNPVQKTHRVGFPHLPEYCRSLPVWPLIFHRCNISVSLEQCSWNRLRLVSTILI